MIRGLFPSKGLPVKAQPETRSLENPSTSLGDPDPWLFEAFGATPTTSGVPVNERTAMQVLAVFACVRIISEAVASLPLLVYERLGRGKQRATDHALYGLLHDQPNSEMSAMTFREVMQAHVLTYGNAYAEIETNRAGAVIGLWPLLPDRTWAQRKDGVRRYVTILPDGTEQPLSEEQVFHLPGLGFDGLCGYSPIQMAKNAIGLTSATEQFGSKFFSNGAAMGGVLEHPGKLSKEAATRLKESFEAKQSGLSNAHRVFIAEEGMKFNGSSIPPNHAQFLETRKFQLAEIARLFRVPPHMIGDLESGASYASVEQMSLDFVTYTLRPWLVRWEQAITLHLFGARERSTYFAEHLVDGLLRGDLQSRYQAYAIGRQWGWLSADDVREIENQNPLPNGQGAIYLIPANMLPADKANEIKAPGSQPPAAPAAPAADAGNGDGADSADGAADPNAQRSAYVALLRDVGERMVKREVPQLRKALRQGEAAWNQSVEAVYREHVDAFAKALTPVFDALLSFGPANVRSLAVASSALARDLAGEEMSKSRRAIDQTPFANIETLLASWEQDRPTQFAERGADFMIKLTSPSLRRVA